jgi:hypothetical protein
MQNEGADFKPSQRCRADRDHGHHRNVTDASLGNFYYIEHFRVPAITRTTTSSRYRPRA